MNIKKMILFLTIFIVGNSYGAVLKHAGNLCEGLNSRSIEFLSSYTGLKSLLEILFFVPEELNTVSEDNISKKIRGLAVVFEGKRQDSYLDRGRYIEAFKKYLILYFGVEGISEELHSKNINCYAEAFILFNQFIEQLISLIKNNNISDDILFNKVRVLISKLDKDLSLDSSINKIAKKELHLPTHHQMKAFKYILSKDIDISILVEILKKYNGGLINSKYNKMESIISDLFKLSFSDIDKKGLAYKTLNFIDDEGSLSYLEKILQFYCNTPDSFKDLWPKILPMVNKISGNKLLLYSCKYLCPARFCNFVYYLSLYLQKYRKNDPLYKELIEKFQEYIFFEDEHVLTGNIKKGLPSGSHIDVDYSKCISSAASSCVKSIYPTKGIRVPHEEMREHNIEGTFEDQGTNCNFYGFISSSIANIEYKEGLQLFNPHNGVVSKGVLARFINTYMIQLYFGCEISSGVSQYQIDQICDCLNIELIEYDIKDGLIRIKGITKDFVEKSSGSSYFSKALISDLSQACKVIESILIEGEIMASVNVKKINNKFTIIKKGYPAKILYKITKNGVDHYLEAYFKTHDISGDTVVGTIFEHFIIIDLDRLAIDVQYKIYKLSRNPELSGKDPLTNGKTIKLKDKILELIKDSILNKDFGLESDDKTFFYASVPIDANYLGVMFDKNSEKKAVYVLVKIGETYFRALEEEQKVSEQVRIRESLINKINKLVSDIDKLIEEYNIDYPYTKGNLTSEDTLESINLEIEYLEKLKGCLQYLVKQNNSIASSSSAEHKRLN